MAEPGKPGRKTKCVPEVTEKILGLIRSGNYRETACAAAGIDSRVMREWLKRGADGEEPYATFSAEMDEAEGQAEARHVLTITSASKDDWRAAAFILKTKYAKRWGEKVEQTVHVTGEVSPEMAAQKVREKFGDHAAKRESADGAESSGETDA